MAICATIVELAGEREREGRGPALDITLTIDHQAHWR
jgi:hypothetical protein